MTSSTRDHLRKRTYHLHDMDTVTIILTIITSPLLSAFSPSVYHHYPPTQAQSLQCGASLHTGLTVLPLSPLLLLVWSKSNYLVNCSKHKANAT